MNRSTNISLNCSQSEEYIKRKADLFADQGKEVEGQSPSSQKIDSGFPQFSSTRSGENEPDFFLSETSSSPSPDRV